MTDSPFTASPRLEFDSGRPPQTVEVVLHIERGPDAIIQMFNALRESFLPDQVRKLRVSLTLSDLALSAPELLSYWNGDAVRLKGTFDSWQLETGLPESKPESGK